MISVEDLLAWLGNPSESDVDTLLEALEERAVDFIQNETDRYFGADAEQTEYVVGDGSGKLYIRERPADITSVEYRTAPGEAWIAITEGASDGWELRLPRSETDGGYLLRKGGSVWTSDYEFRVIYDFGYTAGAEPGEIRQAVIDVVAFLYNERGREGLKSETIGDYSYSIMAEATGKRSILTSIPGLERIIQRWKGLVYA